MKTLKIKRCQSHSDTTIDFHPGVNVFVGESDQGKSAIVRSIRAVALNQPVRGMDNLITGHKGAMEIDLDDVVRVKGKSKNQYVIGGVTHKAFGTSVPDDVPRLLRLSDINFATQHQPYFLINESPGAVARQLNDVADLAIIDRITTKIKQDESAGKELIADLEGDAARLQSEIDSLEWVDGALDLVGKYEKLQEESSALSAGIASVSALINGIRQSRIAQIRAEEEIVRLREILGIYEEMQKIRNAADRLKHIHLLASTQLPTDPTGLSAATELLLAGIRSILLPEPGRGGLPALRSAVAILKRPLPPDPAASLVLVSAVIDGMQAIEREHSKLVAVFRKLDAARAALVGLRRPDLREIEEVVAKRMKLAKALETLKATRITELQAQAVLVGAQIALDTFKTEIGACPLCDTPLTKRVK